MGVCVTTRLTFKPRHLSKSTSLRGLFLLLLPLTGFRFHLRGQARKLGFHQDYNTWGSLHQKLLSHFPPGSSDCIFDSFLRMGQEILAALTNWFFLLAFPCFFVWKCKAILCSFCSLSGIRFRRFCNNNNHTACIDSTKLYQSGISLVYKRILYLFNESNFSCHFF